MILSDLIKTQIPGIINQQILARPDHIKNVKILIDGLWIKTLFYSFLIIFEPQNGLKFLQIFQFHL
ncbi:MAG: hypothetical protein HeimC3_11970 [Candidatus Heimdallarchaeota archaeon LC_3]|nr:MAG: hypothetical protein HeimC3_11970 [Candidatus Heimdallarchaeota archaeon LC_3]